jgi:UDP-galactopyranose mutase
MIVSTSLNTILTRLNTISTRLNIMLTRLNIMLTRLNTIFVDRTSSIPKAGFVAALHRKVRISAQL